MQTALYARFGVARPVTRAAGALRSAVQPAAQPVRATEKEMTDDLGFKLMRRGVKVAAKENILSPRCGGQGPAAAGQLRAPTPPHIAQCITWGCRAAQGLAPSG